MKFGDNIVKVKKNNRVRILIKNNNKNYRLFTVIHDHDKYHEPFIKISVPDIKKKQLNVKEIKKFVLPTEQDNLLKTSNENMFSLIHELSYHYQTGCVHFKNIQDEHLYQKKNMPVLKNEKFLLVTRLVFNDLNFLSEYKKIATTNNIFLKLPFNNLGRLFNIYLLEDINIRLENNNEKLPRLDGYRLNIQGSSVHILIEEHCYTEEKLKPSKFSFSFFLPNDPRVLDI